MELQSLGIIISVVTTILSMLATGFMAAMSWVIKFNDLVHAEKRQEELAKELKEVKDTVNKIAVDLSGIQAACKARHNE